jgi:tRNA-dihydrouridine synthase B
MIGRASMGAPWIFAQTKHYLVTNEIPPPPDFDERWRIILRHCQLAVEEWGVEEHAMRSMRARLMAYSKGFPGSKLLREAFQHVSTLRDIEQIAQNHLAVAAAAGGLESSESVGEGAAFPGKLTASPTELRLDLA